MPSLISSFAFLICIHFLASQVRSLDTLRQGENLNSTSQLVSAGNIFTLGFYSPGGTNNSYIAVWYTGRTDYPDPVWMGNRDNPVPRSADPVLTIDATGRLIITRSGGDSVELYAGRSRQNASARLLDSGNFVVTDSNGSAGEILWQSFDYPTDTFLPGMKLGVNHRNGRDWKLTSGFGVSNPASGPFTLEWNTSERQLAIRRRGVVYWTSGELRDYYFEWGNSTVKEFENIIFKPDPWNLNYNFTYVSNDEEEYFMYTIIRIPNQTPDDRMFVSGWRLNYQGDMSDGYRPTIARASLCYGYKAQGSAVYPGCELWAQPPCRTNKETFAVRSGNFRPVNGTAAPSFYDNNSSLSLSDCRDVCWNDCDCVAYDADVIYGCVYWRGRNLEFEQSLDGSAMRRYVLDSPTSGRETKKRLMHIIIPVVITIGLLILGIAFLIMRKIIQGKREEEIHGLLTLEGYTGAYELENGGEKHHDLRLFSHASILSATSKFSSENKLGEGGFGPVFKGETPEGQDIAVKILSRQSGQGLIEFKTELILISKLQHVNLVRLLGFCIHGDDKMIVYDYMPNKSLDFHLFSPSKREKLDWRQRFNIIEGTAQGLLYLHKYSRLKIIHRDLKPSNILLDENMNPKISDFGLARIFKQNADEANTNRRAGTYGYMAPEHAMQGIFSAKSDVYSFGVLVLEIVSGRKNNCFHQMEGPLNLVEYAWELWSKNSALELMDPTLRDSCIIDQLLRCVHVGLLCVENQAVDRPTIEDVILMLKNEITTMPMPKNPAFTARSCVVEVVEKNAPEKLSANELTITEVGGR